MALELAAVLNVKTPVVVGYEGATLSGDALNLIRAVGGTASVEVSVEKFRVDVVIGAPQAITPENDAAKVIAPGGVSKMKSEHTFTLTPVTDACDFKVNE
jgi:hypothetical protein